MADALIAGEFVMHGARAAMAAGMPHIEEHIKGIERAMIENPGLVFDLAKTLIESACKTILTERGIAFAPDDDLPSLFRTAAMHLPFLPPAVSAEVEVRRSLRRTLNGLHTAVQGVCELRNTCGFASHGADSRRPLMERVQAMLAAQAADAIVGFLHRVHRQDRATLPGAMLEYGDHADFNEYVDEQNEPVRIFNLEYAPSEVLFHIDPEAYRDLLVNFGADSEADDSASTESSGAEASK